MFRSLQKLIFFSHLICNCYYRQQRTFIITNAFYFSTTTKTTRNHYRLESYFYRQYRQPSFLYASNNNNKNIEHQNVNQTLIVTSTPSDTLTTNNDNDNNNINDTITVKKNRESISNNNNNNNNNDDDDIKYNRIQNSDGTYSPRFLNDNGLKIQKDEIGRVTARPVKTVLLQEHSVIVKKPQHNQQRKHENNNNNDTVSSNTSSNSDQQQQEEEQQNQFNVVLTHCTADFDSLASAVGLAKLWTLEQQQQQSNNNNNNNITPTYVVLPRGAHPSVQRFLALHKHLFPIRSLKSITENNNNNNNQKGRSSSSSNSNKNNKNDNNNNKNKNEKSLLPLNKLALVDAQRRDRLGPADVLLQHAKHITVVDHHVDQNSDIPNISQYVCDPVGSVSTLIVEQLQHKQQQQQQLQIQQQQQESSDTNNNKRSHTGASNNNDNIVVTEAEATLLALGIHADTGNLCFDSTTARDAAALTWCLQQGASQAAIAEHAQASLISPEQQHVLTQSLVHCNKTDVQGVTLSTVLLLSEDGFINGLAAVAQDALELSSSDIFILGLVYEAKSGSGSSRRKKKKKKEMVTTTQLLSTTNNKNNTDTHTATRRNNTRDIVTMNTTDEVASKWFAEVWQGGGEENTRRRRLRAAFDSTDTDNSGYLDESEVAGSLTSAGVIAGPETVKELFEKVDIDGNGKIDYDEFVMFATEAEKRQQIQNNKRGSKSTTMIIIGRVKAGINVKAVRLNKLLEQFGGGGHAKAASATVRLNSVSEAEGIMQSLVDQLIDTGLRKQPTVGEFMTSPVLSVRPHMTEKQVEDLFTRYDVRALPVVDDNNEVVGLVNYQLVAAAKQRLWNKEQKRLRREREAKEKGIELPVDEKKAAERGKGTTVKAWMIQGQHVQIIEASKTMAEVESLLLETDVGCIPVVADGTKQLVGMVTRTDLLRQHRYYASLPYHNKGFADSIAARKPIIELRKKLKKFDFDS